MIFCVGTCFQISRHLKAAVANQLLNKPTAPTVCRILHAEASFYTWQTSVRYGYGKAKSINQQCTGNHLAINQFSQKNSENNYSTSSNHCAAANIY
ncbi:hypothetical protein DP923_04855 [Pontibacter arcticus]|uniref:Uncharacterized protein n=1 Tax=Pontibacter arcticus TaxID=2080288 RepID=A0A364RJA7_9BACT|nr:hypothetical protein DP923_04855 [Pontibacter arcticus]